MRRSVRQKERVLFEDVLGQRVGKWAKISKGGTEGMSPYTGALLWWRDKYLGTLTLSPGIPGKPVIPVDPFRPGKPRRPMDPGGPGLPLSPLIVLGKPGTPGRPCNPGRPASPLSPGKEIKGLGKILWIRENQLIQVQMPWDTGGRLGVGLGRGGVPFCLMGCHETPAKGELFSAHAPLSARFFQGCYRL